MSYEAVAPYYQTERGVKQIPAKKVDKTGVILLSLCLVETPLLYDHEISNRSPILCINYHILIEKSLNLSFSSTAGSRTIPIFQ